MVEPGDWSAQAGRDKGYLSSLLASVAIFCLLSYSAAAQDSFAEPRNNFGGAGLIEMPSARMAPDGELSIGGSFFKNTQHYNLGFQILPWLEGSFRYTGLQRFDTAYPVYYDRSFAVKARLWDEGPIWPAFAIGANDILGTGAFGGEYLVASKRVGDVDATVGIGFGRMGSTGLVRNPLTQLSRTFENRTGFPNIVPGSTAFDTLFHGPSAGLFGGAVWNTPFSGLSLIAEYSSDTYALEASRGTFVPRSQLNYGASYQLSDGFILGMAWIYGRSISANLSVILDPTKPQYPPTVGEPPPPVRVRSNEEQQRSLLTLVNGEIVEKYGAEAAERNRFVDDLWRRDSPITDVELRGDVLLITVNDGTLRKYCTELNRLAELYPFVPNVILVRQRNGESQRCNATSSEVPQKITHVPFSAASNVRLSSAAIATIDARNVTSVNEPAAIRTIKRNAKKQSINIEALEFNPGEAVVYYTNTHYFAEANALDRLTRVLMADAPPNVERFRLIRLVDGIAQREFEVLRAPTERNYVQNNEVGLDLSFENKDAPMDNPVLSAAQRKIFPRLSWGIFPNLRQALFDPNQPFGVQLLVGAGAYLEPLPGLSLSVGVETNLYDTFDVTRESDSVLPRVRSDFVNYFREGKNGISHMDAQYRFRLSPSIFGLAKIGYLESMFAGAGGEVLWRPEGQRWAIGADIYHVQQRKFDRLFGLNPYSVTTGHVSLYYQSPWHDLDFAVRAGRYLAGDRGITFEATRRFATGVEIGAFFTKTNVSAARFGEGSFDKGLIIRIPLGWIAPLESQSSLAMDLRPVQRDGGQRLAGDATLFEATRRGSVGEMLRQDTEFANW